MKPQQFVYINPEHIIVPDKYDVHPNTGFDIALIGFHKTSDIETLEKYFESLKNTKNKK
jgi:hypothetical protein